MLYLGIMPSALTTIQEQKIVAFLARGDTHAEIMHYFNTEEKRTLNDMTIQRVAKRNADSLAEIKQRTLKKVEADAQSIKDKANSIIKKQLDAVDVAVEILALAGRQFLAEEITLHEYNAVIKSTKKASMTELVAVSREMHAQSGATPPGGSDPANLAAIRAALESGDEVSLTRLMFKKNGGGPVDGQLNSIA